MALAPPFLRPESSGPFRFFESPVGQQLAFGPRSRIGAQVGSSSSAQVIERMDGERMTKHIFVTGGVVSSLGKGLTCASIGMLLEHRGLRVRLQKFDPYINVDPGHDEPLPARRGLRARRRLARPTSTWATTSASPTPRSRRDCNYTTGKIYLSVIEKERRGELPGQDRPGHPARHRRDQGGRPQAGRPTTWTSSSPRSAARSATSRACRSWRRSASSRSTSASRTACTST